MILSIPVSAGEALDKLSILEIKEEHITNEAKLELIREETAAIESVLEPFRVFDTVGIQELYVGLDSINRRLWAVEDELREMEQRQQFGQPFIDAARSVYQLNDERARFKREINALLGSTIVEVKSYAGM